MNQWPDGSIASIYFRLKKDKSQKTSVNTTLKIKHVTIGK